MVVANCVDPTDAANAIIEANDKQSINEYIYGTLLTTHTDRTIKDPFPGGQSLMEYWKEKGFQFEDENVTQCVVKVNSHGLIKSKKSLKGATNSARSSGVASGGILDREQLPSNSCKYTYPADKVWRVYAFEKVSKHPKEDKLVTEPSVNTKVNAYPFQSINFCQRSSFIAPDGYVLLAADYSQIELRILAHFANDTHLISAMKNGLDVMRDVASSITGKKYDQVTDDERQRAKTVVYGMLYGQTYMSLAQELRISVNEAKRFYTKFRDKYPKSSSCLDNIVKECREKGYITTLLGRKRYLPHINEKKQISKRQQAERQAVNSVCQGSAADLVKVAMIRIYDCFKSLEQDYHKSKGFKKTLEGKFRRPKYYAKLVLQIHDELLFEIREDVIEYIAQLIKLTMENCMDLKVPLQVKMKMGKS